MKIFKLTLAALVMALGLPLLATAQEPSEAPQPQAEPGTEREVMQFQELDANQDGSLTAEEAEQGEISDFAKADRNLDNKLSLDEYVYHARGNGDAR